MISLNSTVRIVNMMTVILKSNQPFNFNRSIEQGNIKCYDLVITHTICMLNAFVIDGKNIVVKS